MAHNHAHGRGKRLGLTIILNISITLAQYIGGLMTGSLALMSDAAHNFSDVIALIISWIADKLSQSSYKDKRTYGLMRAEVLAAVINISTIIIIAFNILSEAFERLSEPAHITGPSVMYLAGLSILINGLSVLIIKKDAHGNMNMKSAYLHLFSDMLTSVAVLFVGAAMYFFNIYWLDTFVSIGISVFLLASSFRLLLDTLKVLMQFTPDSIDVKVLEKALKSMTHVKGIHHLHLWQLNDTDIHMSVHLDFDTDLPLTKAQQQYKEIEALLNKDFNINHVTFQGEYQSQHTLELIYDERKNAEV